MPTLTTDLRLKVAALSPNQLIALRNLASKQAGEAVDWINIADARALTELGLADRGREGWRITPAGSAALAAIVDVAALEEPAQTNISPIRKDDHEGN
jgi:hypothetical protein